MKILVKGFGDLESAIGNTLSEEFKVEDYSLVNASQAYAVISYGKVKVGAAFHLDLEGQSLYLIGNTEGNLSKTDIKKLNMLPERFLEKLTGGPEANLAWRAQIKKYISNHKDHIFRGAIMSSDNPPEAYDHGSINTFIVTHPASKSAFDLDGYAVEVPQFLRGYYIVNSVPTIDVATMIEGTNSISNATSIMLTNLSVKYSNIELTARYLNLAPTPPILVISKANDLTPVAMSKEATTFNSISDWGSKHNQSIGVEKPFVIDNSDNIRYFINAKAVQEIKDDLKSDNKLQEFRTPSRS
jgi:hypothetical protein